MKLTPHIPLCDEHASALSHALDEQITAEPASDYDVKTYACSVPGCKADVDQIVEIEVVPASLAAKSLGSVGGSAKTDAKVAASRSNGAKGGRPRQCCICKAKAVSSDTSMSTGHTFHWCADHDMPENVDGLMSVSGYYAKTKAAWLDAREAKS